MRRIFTPCTLPISLCEHVANERQELRIDFTVGPSGNLWMHRTRNSRTGRSMTHNHPKVTPRELKSAKIIYVLPESQQMILNGLAILP